MIHNYMVYVFHTNPVFEVMCMHVLFIWTLNQRWMGPWCISSSAVSSVLNELKCIEI